MKKFFIIIIGALLLGTGMALFIFHVGDEDCDGAVRTMREDVKEFRQETNGIGRCDGICVRWSPIGCTISDDFDSWFVTWWGSVHRK